MAKQRAIICDMCDTNTVHPKRVQLGYTCCPECGDKLARLDRKRWTIVPAGSKQGYTRIMNKADLIGIYKGSTVR